MISANDPHSAHSVEALETLCRTYWHPLCAYVRRRGYSPADAEDLTQTFFAWLLERNWLGKAEPQRGRFRTFMLTSISNFLANEWDKSRVQKCGGGRVISLQSNEAESQYTWEPTDYFNPKQCFERRWAVTLLEQVMNGLNDEFVRDGKAALFDALKPCLLGERTAQPYATLATKLAMTEGSVKVTVHRLRQRYRQLLRDEIASTVAQPDDVEDELIHLFAVLAKR